MNRNTFPNTAPVDYTDVRAQLRTGDLLMCAGTGWFSKMIQAATKSVWSHVALSVRLEVIDRVMVLESVESVGVRAVPLTKYLRDYDLQGNPYPGRMCLARHADFASRATPTGLAKLGHYAVDQFGYPYDNQIIAKIAARITLTHWLDPTARDAAHADWSSTPIKRDRDYICSEYVWECYQTLGIEIPHDQRGFVTPADFANDPKLACLAVLEK